MTQYERMTAGLIYDPADEEIVNEQLMYMDVFDVQSFFLQRKAADVKTNH